MELYSEGAQSDDFQEDATSDDLGIEMDLANGDAAVQSTFAHTAFDAYFAQNHKSSRTSANIFANIESPLTPQQYLSAIAAVKYARPIQVPWLASSIRTKLFRRCLFELDQGFNLLFYGVGSKRRVLNELALYINDKHQDVVILNAFSPFFLLKDFMASIEKVHAMNAIPFSGPLSPESQLKRIQKCFGSPESDHHLYLVIHNIDAPSLRNGRMKSYLIGIAAIPRVHILTSVDHIAFPNLWSLTEIFSRKYDASFETNAPPSAGYAWLFHDLTTFELHDLELAYANRSSLSGAAQASKFSRSTKSLPGASSTSLMTEDAARHILLSVTERAKKLFVLLGTKQLETMAELDGAGIDPKQLAFDYSMLFNLARDNFVAMNDTTMRALMGEFKDHRLMVIVAQGAGANEAVWIPLRKESLARIVKDLKQT